MNREVSLSHMNNGSGLHEKRNPDNQGVTMNLIHDEIKLDYGNVLLVPGTRTNVTSRKLVNLNCRISFNHNEKTVYEGIPIMAANMDGVGSFAMADALIRHRIFTCLAKMHSEENLIKFFSEDSLRRDYCAITVGLRHMDREKFKSVNQNAGPIKFACLDVANGHTQRFVSFLEEFRSEFPEVVIIAGNVVTPEQTEILVKAGADLVKIGIGGGSVCETRIKTGVGYPQFSAVVECGHAAREAGAHIVADGGCTCPGDVAKALAAGSAFVMLGGMFAGHKEGGGRVVTRRFNTGEITDEGKAILQENKYVEFYGMSSQIANNKHFDGLQPWKTSEGREVLLPFKPSIDETVQDMLGGLRSACTYLGAGNLQDLPQAAKFVQCHDTHNRVFEDSPISDHSISSMLV